MIGAFKAIGRRRWAGRLMRRSSLVLLLASASASASMPPAPSPTLAAPSASAQEPFDWQSAHGVLFRIRSTRAGAPDSLLLGTIHIGAPLALGLDPQRIQQAVVAQRILVNEVAGDTPWQPRYDHYRLLAAGQSLATLIGGLQFIKLATLLPDHRGTALNRFKPWVAMTLLEEGQDAPLARADGPGRRNMDATIEDIARAHGLKLVHLETLEDQLAALDCTPAADYAVVLRQRLADPQALRAETERALAFYRAGDLAGWLADIDAMSGLDAPARVAEQHARDCLVDQRNARWIEELEPLLRDGGCFVAVGAIHLTGPDGLLAGLARRGFTVSEQAW
ncbi:MAG: TraB/GumN family protein [Rhodanobacter sp.]